ncbi:MAG: L,D-transpeptidase family protein [Patescibacteria group bacterium]
MKIFSRIAYMPMPLWLVVLIYGVSLWGAVFFHIYIQGLPIYNITIPSFEGEEVAIDYGPQLSLQEEFYFNSVKEAFIESESSFILANLKDMRIRLYKEGEVQFDFPIAAKGRGGTWTETPAGLYSVEWKAEEHFSSLYEVYMPYSIQFFGNYFMHGWPYHPDGRDVVSSTSAGCIRMETEDAKRLYEEARPGMPVLVFEEGYSRDDFSYFNSVGEVKAENYLAIDLKSDFVFSNEKTEEKFPIHSFTKLPIALVASEKFFIGTSVTISKETEDEETDGSRFEDDEEVTIFTLLAAILTESSEKATATIADRLGKDAKVSLEKYLRTLGMRDTYIKDPISSPQNSSNFNDIVRLSKYLYFNRSSLLKMSRGEFSSVYIDPEHRDMEPAHSLSEDPAFVGGFIPQKGGEFEEFGLAIFEIEARGETRPIAVIVANSSEPVEDIVKIFDSIRLSP